MEADWAVALGADDPVILVPWASSREDARQCRFIDLRADLSAIDAIEEARATPPLRAALLVLNGEASQWWTAKCDAWTSSAAEGSELFDPFEMEAEPGETKCGAGCYIDLAPREAAHRSDFAMQEQWMRSAVKRLRNVSATAARVDFVLRPAVIDNRHGFAVTCLVEGCGATAQHALQSWVVALHAALLIVAETRL